VKIGKKLSGETSFPIDKSFTKNLGKRNLSSIVIHPINKFEISNIIVGLNSHKSTGYIDIMVTLIKESKLLISQNLANIFNKCLEDGIYSDVLKIVKVIPLHKGGTKFNTENYRPISILFPINKIFETILHQRLMEFWEKCNHFTNCQFGFRKKNLLNLQ